MKYNHKQLLEIIRNRTGKPMLVRELMRLLVYASRHTGPASVLKDVKTGQTQSQPTAPTQKPAPPAQQK